MEYSGHHMPFDEILFFLSRKKKGSVTVLNELYTFQAET